MTKTIPFVPVDHPDFKWSPGGDVQSVWRKYGWLPPSLKMSTPPPEKQVVEKERFRRVK